MSAAPNKPLPPPIESWPGELLVLLAGALVPLAFAPYHLWPVGIVTSGLLGWSLRGLSPGRAWARSLLFGLGMFGTGVSWVYISIHDFGAAPPLLAGVMTAAFVSFIALVFSLPFYVYQRFASRGRLGQLLGFPAIWVLGEWTRSWLLTGFPWLYLGYSHLDTWLSGWAPVTGVYGLSFITVFTGVALFAVIQASLQRLRGLPQSAAPCAVCAALPVTLCWLAGLTLQPVNWTHSEDEISVAIVQPNVPLALKWNPFYRQPILRKLRDLTDEQWENDLIVWPEAAIPLMYHEATDFIEELETRAAEHHTALVTGILYDAPPNKYYNSIIGIGSAENIYFKQRLVPFGEYVPLEKYLRGLIAFFDLPNSIIFPGPTDQKGLATPNYNIAPYICYEIVYPDLVATNLADAKLMITISNDAWFGDSIGPLQHFQIARMRALENGRYLIRGTNTGLSGIISDKGKVTLAGNQFVAQTIVGTVYLNTGLTPFSRTGSVPIVLLCIALLVSAWLMARKE